VIVYANRGDASGGSFTARMPGPLLVGGLCLLVLRALAGSVPLVAAGMGTLFVVSSAAAQFWLGEVGPGTLLAIAFLFGAGGSTVRALVAGWRLERLYSSKAVPRARLLSRSR
jgi:hypothetical protein